MIRVAVTGPESSGKTTLSKELCQALSEAYVLEYAREYLEQREGKYDEKDLDEIAEGQLALFRKHTGNVLIADTDFTVLKVWSEVKYGKVSDHLIEIDENFQFDLYLLCLPDIPWEPDLLRENPNDRWELVEHYRKALSEKVCPVIEISGSREERFQTAIEAIRALMK